MKKRKLVRNRGEVKIWYIEDDHESHCFPELWQKSTGSTLEANASTVAGGPPMEELAEENYRLHEQMLLYNADTRFYKRIYSNGNRLNWGVQRYKAVWEVFSRGNNISTESCEDRGILMKYVTMGKNRADKGKKEIYLSERSLMEKGRS